MPKAALDTHAEVRKLEETGCSEEQAVATVDLVVRAPVNAQIVTRFDGLEVRFDVLEVRFDGLEGRFDALEVRFDGLERRLDKLESRVETIEANMATKADLESLRADMIERQESFRADMIDRLESFRTDMVEANMTTKVSIEATKAEFSKSHAGMIRMLWFQTLALASLIIGLATAN